MITKFILLVLSVTFSNFINGADPTTLADVRIDIAEELRATSQAPSLNIESNSFSGSEDFGASSSRAGARSVSRASSLHSERGSSYSVEDSAAIAHRTRINAQRVTEAHNILSDDFIDNLKDLKKTRWFFRKAASYTECIGNVLLYVGAGLSTISSAVCFIGANEASNMLSFTGSACIVAHVAFIGIARCSASEERERENHLRNLARKVEFSLVPLPHTVIDGADDAVNSDRANAESHQA